MIDPALLNLLPPLRRARGERLYGPDQRHWVDLWKQDGAWLFGHRPEGAAREWKNQLDKGLATWAPSLWPRRLEQLVPRLLPGVTAVRVFRNVDRAPALAAWRPFEGPVPTDAFRLVLPSGPAQAVAVAYTAAWTAAVPESDVTAPAEVAALVSAVGQLLRFTHDARAQASREAAAVAFDRLPARWFRRRGLWFDVTVPAEQYAGFYRSHVDAGFVLNPDRDAPGLIPLELSAGEWAAWARAVDSWTAGRA